MLLTINFLKGNYDNNGVRCGPDGGIPPNKKKVLKIPKFVLLSKTESNIQNFQPFQSKIKTQNKSSEKFKITNYLSLNYRTNLHNKSLRRVRHSYIYISKSISLASTNECNQVYKKDPNQVCHSKNYIDNLFTLSNSVIQVRNNSQTFSPHVFLPNATTSSVTI